MEFNSFLFLPENVHNYQQVPVFYQINFVLSADNKKKIINYDMINIKIRKKLNVTLTFRVGLGVILYRFVSV